MPTRVPLSAAEDDRRSDTGAGAESSPAERFERYLAQNPPAPREKPALSWQEIALRAVFIIGGVALYGGLAYGIARMVGWVP